MNRKNFVLAILAGLTGAQWNATQIVKVTSDGLAKVLIYPYYRSTK